MQVKGGSDQFALETYVESEACVGWQLARETRENRRTLAHNCANDRATDGISVVRLLILSSAEFSVLMRLRSRVTARSVVPSLPVLDSRWNDVAASEDIETG